MGLWGRLARLVSGGGPAARAEAILDRLGSGVRDEAALEGAVAELLGSEPAPLARADRPPTRRLVRD